MAGETTTIACMLYPGLTVLDLADTCDPMPTDAPRFEELLRAHLADDSGLRPQLLGSPSAPGKP